MLWGAMKILNLAAFTAFNEHRPETRHNTWSLGVIAPIRLLSCAMRLPKNGFFPDSCNRSFNGIKGAFPFRPVSRLVHWEVAILEGFHLFFPAFTGHSISVIR